MDRAERAKRAKKTKPLGDKTGTNPNSLKNLVAHRIQPGEVRNPLGINGRQPYSSAMRELANKPMPETLRLMLNTQVTRLIRKWLGRKTEVPDLFFDGITWAEANALRRHVRAVIGGDTRSAVEIREAVEGRATQRIELGQSNDRLTLLLAEFAEARKRPPLPPKPATET